MKFLTFGEIMLRLKAPGQECFFQSPMLEATFGGGEANVAVSLANYGEDAAFLTVLPDNAIADACKAELRRFDVDTKRIVTGEGRMGIYYLEGGANQRPSKVVYDRAYSAIALAKPGDIDWDKAFDGVEWFHITGITPAISESAMELSVASVKEAKKRGITVSCDLNYRKNLWKYGKKASEVMREIAKFVDVAIANEEDVQVKAGSDFGALLLNGLVDGIVLDAPNLPNNADAVAYSFGILQAARRRTTKTEYISCPSCGRTLYDLQHAVKEIKAATSHLKGLKIGIMGCIVNGPGEMADADYGYVGAAVGKVSLYKGKECVERNVPQDVALTHLIDLIKANGDWTEPKQ